MRMQSGITDQYIYFVAVDSTDYVTRKTGLSAFTVYRARNGGAATAYTTPTIAEVSAANMPGVYTLLLDEDMTIDAGDDSQEICLHITCATMAPVTRTIELYRPTITAGATLTVANGAADADIERIQGTVIATPATAGVLDVNMKNIANAAVSTSTAQLGVNVVNFGGSAGTFASGRPEVNVSHFGGTAGTFSSGRPEVNTTHAAGTAWNSGAIGASTLASDTITAAKIAADAIGASELAADAVTEIRSVVNGTSDSGTTTTMVDAARTEADTDYWKGQIIVFTSGNIAGQARLITGFNAGTDTITFAPATTQAVSTQTYEIWPQSSVDVQQWLQTTVSTPTVAGVPNVNCKTWNDLTTVALPLVPTTAGRTLDVSAGGEAGIDWANIGSPTTVQGLSGTTIKTATDVETDTQDIQSRLPAALVSGRIDASVGAMAANVMTAAATAADYVTELQAGLSTLDAAAVRSAVGLASANLDTQLSTIDDFLDTEIAAIKAKTDQLTFTVAGQVDANAESMNGAAILGNGTSGNLWRGS